MFLLEHGSQDGPIPLLERSQKNMRYILGLRLPSIRRDSNSGIDRSGGSEVKAELMAKLKQEQERSEHLQRELEMLRGRLEVGSRVDARDGIVSPLHKMKLAGESVVDTGVAKDEESSRSAARAVVVAGEKGKEWVEEIYKGVFITLGTILNLINSLDRSSHVHVCRRKEREHGGRYALMKRD